MLLETLCTVLALSCNVELGYIPGHDLSLYSLEDTHKSVLNIDHTGYADFQAKLSITKYAEINGGITSFVFPVRDKVEGYPYRMDFNIGAELHYKNVSVGCEQRCYHPIAPNINTLPLPRLDSSNNRFYVKVTLGSTL